MKTPSTLHHTLIIRVGDDKETELRAGHVYEEWSFHVPVAQCPISRPGCISRSTRSRAGEVPGLAFLTLPHALRKDAMDVEIIRKIGEGAVYTYFNVASFSPPVRRPIPNELANEIPL
jgi:hypothetical protein